MLGWFRRMVKRWLDAGPPEPVLEVLVGGEVRRVVPYASRGMGLLCNVPSPSGMRQQMILESHAVDKRHFWRLWQYFGGSAIWADDGAPFTPNV